MTISTQRLRFLRGNSTAAGSFTGLQGELIFDTTLYTLRLQDGVTPGGYPLATASDLANVSANANYGNSNVASYLTTYTGNLTAGNIVSGNILPSANVTYSLGSSSQQWKDLWLSNNTIYLGGFPLTITANGTLQVNGSPVSGTGNYGNANVVANVTSTGLVVTGSVKISFGPSVSSATN